MARTLDVRLSLPGGYRLSSSRGISRTAAIVIVVIILVAAAATVYFVSTSGGQSTSSTTGSSTTSSSTTSSTITTTGPPSSSSTSGQIPSTLTYETTATAQFLDPQVLYDIYGSSVVSMNVYEPLFSYNGTNGVNVVPWLAQGYNLSSDGRTLSVSLRSGIKFADGEPLNASAVYFSYNRILVMDGSAPIGHGTQASWIFQQLLNTSLSTTLCACSQTYGTSYAQAVISEHFVQITGPQTVELHIMNPNAAVLYFMAHPVSAIVAPGFVMQHDLALWSQSSNNYQLPYPTLTGNETQRTNEYMIDYQATCNAGATPKGCGATYLDNSVDGSQGGTGPYTLQSVNTASNIITMTANPNYWGSPSGKEQAQIKTIIYKYVPDQTTREIDLQNAAASGQAMIADVAPTNIYDVASRTDWTTQNKLVSTVPGVTIYGPYTQYATWFIPLDTNVTNPFTGTYYSFQPFADYRLRLAFADSVNLTLINEQVNNKLGAVANGLLPPGIPPSGTNVSSSRVAYSYSPGKVQQLLLDAMMNPITHFTYENGTAAPSGVFSNSFGCTTLNSGGTCDHATPQTIPLVYATGDTIDEAILNQVAGTINNISTFYNMGLSVQVTPLPCGQMTSEAFSGEVYAWAESCFGWYDDYPWALDFLEPIVAPGGIYAAPEGWNTAQMGAYWNAALEANSKQNMTELLNSINSMSALANEQVSNIWTFYPDIYMVMTSNIKGFAFNPAFYTTGEPSQMAPLY